ncbi:BrnT family toxin [Thiothrix litoralis]|uniref:BrnT family toxin n=1 Tax=Thiothrix litoralis TaxID=2891210 RepID=A0ABX7WR82_9GAMM|nr:BrnT family toxin [Thiothrix litoralis]QTR46391.1 BrnT family toxin [Thiothrix litoralis]
MKLKFEWDTNKEKANIKKHGLSFTDAETAFHDEYAMQFYDPDHSDDEDRFILLGTISARHADTSEQAAYWSNRP